MTLLLSQYVNLPPHQLGGFDHADVHLGSGCVYVAHTSNGTVEVIDGRAVVVLDISTGHEEAVVPIGGRPDIVWFSAQSASPPPRQSCCAARHRET